MVPAYFSFKGATVTRRKGRSILPSGLPGPMRFPSVMVMLQEVIRLALPPVLRSFRVALRPSTGHLDYN